MVQKIDLTNLPSDVASNIASFMLGKPEDLRLKHNKALKKIQRKYKPYFTEEDRYEYEYFEQQSDCSEIDFRGIEIGYFLLQGEHVKPLYHFIAHQYKKLQKMIKKENEEQVKQHYSLEKIHLRIARRYKDEKEYNTHIFIDNDRQDWRIENVDDFDDELKQLIKRKIDVENTLYTNDNGGAVVSSYKIRIDLDFKDMSHWKFWYNYFEKWLYESFFLHGVPCA